MGERRFTPGPWRVDPKWPADIQTSNEALEIASTSSAVLTGGLGVPDREERCANARLIAEAPALFDVAERATVIACRCHEMPMGLPDPCLGCTARAIVRRVLNGDPD